MFVDLATEFWPPMEPENAPSIEASPEPRYAGNSSVLEELSTRVLLFNDMVHTFDEVIGQVCKAIGCAKHKANAVAWEVHTHGYALVFEGEIFECLQVSSVLEEIALRTQVLT